MEQKSEAIKKQEVNRLKKWLTKLLPEHWDKFDLAAYYDSSLSYDENKTEIRDKVKLFIDKDLPELVKTQVEEAKEEQEKYQQIENQRITSEVEEYNKQKTVKNNVQHYYKDIYRAVSKVVQGFSNLAFIKGRGGLGKCAVGETEITTTTGELVKIKDKPKTVFTMDDENLKLVPSKVKNYFERQVNSVLKIKLRSGREITVTKEHPFFKFNGWTTAEDLIVEDQIATPRRYNLKLKDNMDDNELRILGYLIADGGLTTSTPVFTKKDKRIVEDLKKSLGRWQGVELHRREYEHKNYDYALTDTQKDGRENRVTKFLRENNLFGKKSIDKEIPPKIFRTSNRQIAIFLGCLFDCDGSVEKKGLSYSTGSKRLFQQLIHLLLRFGLSGTARTKIVKGKEYYELQMLSKEMIEIFARNFSLIKKRQKLKDLVERKKKVKGNNNIDVFPTDVFDYIKRGEKYYRNNHCIYVNKKYRPSKTKLTEINKATPMKELQMLIDSDIYWDEIIEITTINKRRTVYDLEVEHSSHNFVANDIVIHNSYNIRYILQKEDAKFLEVAGDVSEAYLYRLFCENNGKIIWFKDVAKLLKGLKSINLLKAATETEGVRLLTKNNYSRDQADLPSAFFWTGRILFDYNSLQGLSLKEDFKALTTRGDYIDFSLSMEDVKEIMRKICTNQKDRETTSFVIKNYQYVGYEMLNLRTQWKTLNTRIWAEANNLDWKTEILDEMSKVTSVKKMLYTLIGNKAIRSADLKKLLIRSNQCSSLRTADRLIADWLVLEEIYQVSLEKKNFYVCIHDIRNR